MDSPGTVAPRKRGRPRKPTLDPLAARRAALEKHAAGECLTLDEIRFAMWDPQKAQAPMTTMGIQKFLTRTLQKVKVRMIAAGFTKEDAFPERTQLVEF